MSQISPSAPPADSPLTLRPARAEDIPPLARLWATAFPGSRSASQRVEELEEGTGRYGGLESCWVGEVDGRFVGGLRSYRMELSLWGQVIPTQGLAAVAVSPEARQQGVGAALCRAALQQAREEGQELSLLYPYRADFYRRLGYTLAGELHRYIVAPEEFPRFPEAREARMVSPDQALQLIPPFYDEAHSRTQGLIARSGRLWSFLKDPQGEGPLVVVVPGSGESAADPAGSSIRGYLVAGNDPGRSREKQTLRIQEMVVADLATHRALLGWISLQRDQWRRVIYDALPGEHLERLLGHPRRQGSPGARGGLWFASATLLRGPMLRVVNAAGILSRTGLPAGSTLPLQDPVLPENTGVWTGTDGGDVQRRSQEAGDGALPVAVLAELFLDGALPGHAQAVEARGWSPLMGIQNFRLLDTF